MTMENLRQCPIYRKVSVPFRLLAIPLKAILNFIDTLGEEKKPDRYEEFMDVIGDYEYFRIFNIPHDTAEEEYKYLKSLAAFIKLYGFPRDSHKNILNDIETRLIDLQYQIYEEKNRKYEQDTFFGIYNDGQIQFQSRHTICQ